MNNAGTVRDQTLQLLFSRLAGIEFRQKKRVTINEVIPIQGILLKMIHY
jgi:hypothetical protein